MCFGSSEDKASREMIDMQKEEARLAREREVKRQARITSGLGKIKGAFHGTPVMAPKAFDWKTFNPATAKAGAVPGMAGFTFVNQPAVAAVPGRPATVGAPGQGYGDNVTAGMGTGSRGTGGGYSGGNGTAAVPGTPAQAGGWVIKGPDGKLYKRGDAVSGSYATGKTTGGIGDEFFNSFKQGILDYYTPQVAEKYQDAKDETTFRLARAGTLKSSAGAEAASDLARQNLVNVAGVRSKADTAAADLRSRTAAEEAKAVSQLYATENPDVAANQATAAIRNITAEEAPTSPLGDIFNLAAIGGARYLQGADNAAFSRRVGALPKPQQRVVI